ncbi:ribonuclease domain-containing protein [Kitasatospora sp. NPDC091207]|uniref:ribonuclease domain-containing protein n=1 Tax=Kitasatospora sp. NPDC091207 TaxID=3364083 RepID=UPI003827D032
MTSKNRLSALAAVLICALAAVVGYLLSDDGTDRPKAAASASAPSSVASAGATATGPRPSAPRSSPPAGTTPAPAGGWVPADPALADVCRTKLPTQALDTLGLIARGGPYPYRSDGIVFENRENRLPRKASGYYHEYTVVTPGSGDRGARRVVTGGIGEQYWTADHYGSFQEIDARC